jgi:Zn-dependent peptidase ImmA (M78 family)
MRVDVLACLKVGEIRTTSGVKKLTFLKVPDQELGENDAMTTFEGEKIAIRAKESVVNAALFGDGRSRFTLAHELGHAVLHSGAPKARPTVSKGPYKSIAPSGSAERQANVFAAAFLVGDHLADSMDSAEKLSTEFGVSLKVAEIEFERVEKRKNRTKSVERVRQLTEEFKRATTPVKSAMSYLPDACSVCKSQMLFPVGPKIMCQHCDTIFDRFQDGDEEGIA